MKTAYDGNGFILLAFLIFGLLGWVACDAGANAMDEQFNALDGLRAERAERVYGSANQFEQFVKENK